MLFFSRIRTLLRHFKVNVDCRKSTVDVWEGIVHHSYATEMRAGYVAVTASWLDTGCKRAPA